MSRKSERVKGKRNPQLLKPNQAPASAMDIDKLIEQRDFTNAARLLGSLRNTIAGAACAMSP